MGNEMRLLQILLIIVLGIGGVYGECDKNFACSLEIFLEDIVFIKHFRVRENGEVYYEDDVPYERVFPCTNCFSYDKGEFPGYEDLYFLEAFPENELGEMYDRLEYYLERTQNTKDFPISYQCLCADNMKAWQNGWYNGGIKQWKGGRANDYAGAGDRQAKRLDEELKELGAPQVAYNGIVKGEIEARLVLVGAFIESYPDAFKQERSIKCYQGKRKEPYCWKEK